MIVIPAASKKALAQPMKLRFSNAPCSPCSGASPIFSMATTVGLEAALVVGSVRAADELSLFERPCELTVRFSLPSSSSTLYASSPHMRQLRMIMCATRCEKLVTWSDCGEGIVSVVLGRFIAGVTRGDGDDEATDTNVL